LHSLETAQPGEPVNEGQKRTRSIYRTVINVAGIYYYISIPVVICLLLAVVGVVLYITLSGTISTMLIALGFGALITIYSMIRSLFVKRKDEDPGRSLAQQEAPGLWALTQEVASTVGTRPVTEIRVTPGTDVAVYERGRFRERMKDQAERILIVGVGVLNDFKQNDFRAVLAHEYGHFLNRDTAGGDMAMRVSLNMSQLALNIVRAKQNTYLNLGFHFLRIYHRIFMRISHGAGRLQEALADRHAAYHYGAAAFEEGLRHVVRRQVEFKHLASREISAAASSNRAISNLYELSVQTDPDQKPTIERGYQDAITRQTTELDSHPSPIDRFRFVNMVASRVEAPADGMVWDLFTDRQALTLEMNKRVDGNLRR
jgi:Zn-dependent protease with chaperone function